MLPVRRRVKVFAIHSAKHLDFRVENATAKKNCVFAYLCGSTRNVFINGNKQKKLNKIVF